MTIFTGYPYDERPSDWDVSTGFDNSRIAFESRKKENVDALFHTGSKLINLDFLDVVYREKPLDDSQIEDSIVSLVSPNDKILFPLGFSFGYRHQDHILLREVGKNLMRNGYDISFYADLPYCIKPGKIERWPDILPTNVIKKLLDAEIEIELIELEPDQSTEKFAAVKKYVSQFEQNNSLSGGILSDPKTYQWEVIINPI